MIELDQELIRRSNNQSMYNRGTHIQEDAEIDYRKFVEHYSNRQLNDKQLEILEKRKVQFKELLTSSYNSYLSSASNFVPVTVAGPSNYPGKKMDKVMDSMNNKIKDMEDKIDKFYKNTDDMLKNAYTKEEILNMYRNGYSDPISSDDPLAKEKLQAKLEHYQEKHQSYLDFNKKARKDGTQQLPPYVLANSNQNIKSIKDRLLKMEKLEQAKLDDYYFDKGEVRFEKNDNRIRIYFDEKPDEEMRDTLKRNAFKWSPKNMCWQRQITPNAIYTTKNLFKDIGSLEIVKVADYTKDNGLTL